MTIQDKINMYCEQAIKGSRGLLRAKGGSLQGVLKGGGGGGARFSRSGSHPPLPQTAPFFPFFFLK
ncbi:hypothetical protein MBAV_003768 [Candidatus Magnetobacterium bavaricum]|uniref:Uncharacterized protein n=1 Tax=Candidatus Magnetobacterium bavaricum TaxID=29290 RepID=A0A0F3GTL9_9BACT|nr:hypothetical protein MBAV_003768 [Candidatus Magnetobacterium bavaricum]